MEERVLHAQWTEDALPGKSRQGFPGDPFDDQAEQRVAGVAVIELGSGHEIQAVLALHQPHDVLFGDHVLHAPSGHGQQVPLVAQPAGVVEQLANPDDMTEVRQFRQVAAHVVVQRQLSVLGEQQYRKRRELLRQRRDMEGRGRRDRTVLLDIGHAEPAPVDDLAVLDHLHGCARRVGPVPSREQGVYLLLLAGERRLCICRQASGQRKHRKQREQKRFQRTAQSSVDASVHVSLP